MLGVHFADAQRGVAAFHDVAPTGAVHVQVDKAGQHQRLGRGACGLFANGLALDALDAPIGPHGQRAADETVGGEDVALDHAHRSRLISATKS